jgi:7,8-dihydroneopterin aldolase/epimerase/oxygenase
MYTVFVEGLEFYAYHGVPAEEKVLGHRYIADIYVEVEGGADDSDKVSETVDYGELGLRVMEFVGSTQGHTLERLAAKICEDVLSQFPLVSEVHIKLAKPHPPTPIIAAMAGVELVRRR